MSESKNVSKDVSKSNDDINYISVLNKVKDLKQGKRGFNLIVAKKLYEQSKKDQERTGKAHFSLDYAKCLVSNVSTKGLKHKNWIVLNYMYEEVKDVERMRSKMIKDLKPMDKDLMIRYQKV